MTSTSGSVSSGKRPASRALHALDSFSSASWVALTVVTLDLLWVGFSLRFEFPPRLETIFPKVLKPLPLPIDRGPQLFSLFLCISNPDPKAIGLASKIGDHILKVRMYGMAS